MSTPNRPRGFFMAWSARIARTFTAINLPASAARPARRTDA